jgi:hypothetical protein
MKKASRHCRVVYSTIVQHLFGGRARPIEAQARQRSCTSRGERLRVVAPEKAKRGLDY